MPENGTNTGDVTNSYADLDCGAITASGIIKTDDTEATIADGSLQTDGGLSVYECCYWG